jgi:hypothetical protein
VLSKSVQHVLVLPQKASGRKLSVQEKPAGRRAFPVGGPLFPQPPLAPAAAGIASSSLT